MFDFDYAIRRVWPVLHEAIRMRRTISYSELAGRAGPPLHHRHLHRQILIPLSERCRIAGLPDLAALVVRKDSGMPGRGWHGPFPSTDPVGTWVAALEDCFVYPWPVAIPAGLTSLQPTPPIHEQRATKLRKECIP